MSGPICVSFYCTDRGQHPWTELGDLTLNQLLRANMGTVTGAHATRRRPECVWLDDIRRPDYRVHLACPRCRRHVQWRGEHAADRLRRLDETGVSQVDLSHL